LWWDQGKPAPVAVVIGAEPTYLLAAAQHLPFGIDEHMLASALLGSPLQTVKCESSDLDIPGSAEIVIEGEMPPGRTQIEGPFGEFLGYMGPSDPSPVIEINAITRRRDALYVGSYEGMPDVETHALYRLNLENNLRLVLGNLGPVITDVYVPNGSAGMAARIAIRKRLETDGLQVINGAFNVWTFKFVTVFDDDVDIRDEAKVQWATVSRVQPDRDLVFGRGQAYTLDPSAYRQPPARLTATTSRLGIDATRSLLSERPPVLRFSPDLERRVSARWSEFGL
jgi:UbiD family decarboxylase